MTDRKAPVGSHIVIIGAGAVGSWLAAALSATGAPVTLVARREHAAKIATGGLTAKRGYEEFRVPVTVAPTIAAAISAAPPDVVILAVKSYDTAQVAEELAAALGATPSTTSVLTFQNGVGNEAVLAAVLPQVNVTAAVLTTWARIEEPGVVLVGTRGGAGLSRQPFSSTSSHDPLPVSRAASVESLGPPTARGRPHGPAAHLPELAENLQLGGVRTRFYPDGLALKWSKLLLNMIASATGAALDWPPPQVLAHPALRAVELAAWREAIAVMAASSIRPVSLPGYPVDWFVQAVRNLPDSALVPLARAAGRGRGGRVPGPVEDLRRGRGRTEVEVIQGAVARAGAACGVGTPVNTALDRLVAQIASGQELWERYRGRPDEVVSAVQKARS